MREKKLPSQTLPDFQQYLLSRKLVPGKSVTFYTYWANRYLTFSKRLKNADAAEALRRFLQDLQSRENIVDCKLVSGIGNSIMIDVPILYITLACSIDNTCVTVKAKCRRHCFIKESMDGMCNVFSVRENVSSMMEKGVSVETEKTRKGNSIPLFMENPLSSILVQLKRLLSTISFPAILDSALPVQVAI
jgi:hypothetical protein